MIKINVVQDMQRSFAKFIRENEPSNHALKIPQFLYAYSVLWHYDILWFR